jgi:hypothetical protein
MSTRASIIPFAIAASAATATLLFYTFSNYSISKSSKKIPPVHIRTSIPAKEVYARFRDPSFYLSLTPESGYTVQHSSPTDNGVTYTLHHQISSTREQVTECKREWNGEGEDLVFWDLFPVLGAGFRVCCFVAQEMEGVVSVSAELEIEGSLGLRGFFGFVSARQIGTRLERLKQVIEKEGVAQTSMQSGAVSET